MANFPQNPNRRDLVLYDQVTLRTNSTPTADIINNSVDYLRKSVANRESSANETAAQDLSSFNLQPGALVRLDRAGTGIIAPDVAPAFADGGYSDIDEVFYANVEEAGAKHPQLSNLQNGTTITVGTDSGFRYIGDSNATATNRPAVLATAPYPFRLPLRVRGIVRMKDFNFYISYYDEFGRYRGQFSIRQNTACLSGGANAYHLIATGGYDSTTNTPERTRISNLPTLIGANWAESILVFEITLTTTVDNNQRPFINITGTLGYYDSITAAYGDTRPGRAFACLDPDHPTYLGTLIAEGFVRRGSARNPVYNGNTGEIRPGLWANRMYYYEVLTGSIYNNINNFVIEDLPETEEQTPEAAAGLDTIRT